MKKSRLAGMYVRWWKRRGPTYAACGMTGHIGAMLVRDGEGRVIVGPPTWAGWRRLVFKLGPGIKASIEMMSVA